MGVVKQMMMEMEEARWEAADVNFHCPRCEKTVDGHTELPIVYDEGGQEHLPISIQCALCDDVYDAWVKTDWNTCDIQLDVSRFRAVHKFIVFHLKPRHLVNLQLQSRRSIAASPMQHPQRSQRTLLAR